MHRRRYRLQSTRYWRNQTATSAAHNYDALTLRCRRIRLIFGPRSSAVTRLHFAQSPAALVAVDAIMVRYTLY